MFMMIIFEWIDYVITFG